MKYFRLTTMFIVLLVFLSVTGLSHADSYESYQLSCDFSLTKDSQTCLYVDGGNSLVWFEGKSGDMISFN